MNSLETKLGRLTLKNPVICASGCVGFGYELARFADLSKAGAITLKTVTPEPRQGNAVPRVREVDAGLHSSIGLQNPGKDVFFSEVMPKVFAAFPNGEKIIVNIGSANIDGFVELAAEIENIYPNGEIAAIEVNASCPNVAGPICQDPKMSETLIKEIRAVTNYPVIAKMNTNNDNYCQAAAAMEAGGADALCLANTPMGMVIDLGTKKPFLGNIRGTITGPAVRPFGILKTWEIYKRVSIPIIAGGGICTTEHALEYLMAGATALDVGSIHYSDPQASEKIVDGLEKYLVSQDIANINELVGAAHYTE